MGGCDRPRKAHSRAQTMVCVGSAYGQLLERLRRQYPPFSAPVVVQAQMRICFANMSLIAAAESLGWIPFE